MARGATSISYTAKSVRRQPTFSPLDKSRRVFLISFLSMIALASACAIFYVGTHIQAVNLGYDIGQELQRKEALIEENKRLDLEIARLKSPTRIEAEAKEKLGLTLPKTQQVFYLSRLEDDSLLKISGAVPAETKPQDSDKATAPKVAVKAPSPSEKSPALAKPLTSKATSAVLGKAEPEKAKTNAPQLAKAEAVSPKPAKPAMAPVKTGNEKIVAIRTDLPAAKPNDSKMTQHAPAKASGNVKSEAPTRVAKSDLSEKPEAHSKKSDLFKSQKLGKPEKTLAMKNASATPEAKPAVLAQAPAKSIAAKEKLANPAKKTEGVKSETAKNDFAKSPVPKSSAKEKLADTRIAKGEDSDVLVAKIVSRESPREKPGKTKSGSFQGKDKVPAVMLDTMP